MFLRILRSICTLLSTYEDTATVRAKDIAESLVLGECRVALHPVLTASYGDSDTLPYAPVLYREAIQDLMFLSLQESQNPIVTVGEGTCGPFSTYPVALLLPLLFHPISEVREGLLLGCIKAVATISESSSSGFSQYLLHGIELLECLLMRAARETEPPIRVLTLQLMCR